jgi:ribonucleotide reductase alpha subunit
MSVAGKDRSNSFTEEMYVIKRNGERKIVSFDKILKRIKSTGQECGIQINYTALAMKVIDQLYDGITTTQIDELTAEQCASLASMHPDYNTLAGWIMVSNHQKNTSASFSDVMQKLYLYRDKHDNSSPLVSDELINIVLENLQDLDAICDYSRDYLIDYFGFKTLDRSYLMKINRKTVERPQHMWLRVAIGIHQKDYIRDPVIGMIHIRQTYEMMSQKYFTHATPTLFNAGTPHPQLSSCFLLALEHDSIDGIYNTLKDCAIISKWAGGIGLHIHNVRATGSHIRGTNGSSNGIVPMLRVFNNTAKYVDQCLTPDTKIYTTEGLIPISKCIAGMTRVCNMELPDFDDYLGSQESSGIQKISDFIHSTIFEQDDNTIENRGYETVQKVLEHLYSGPLLHIRSHLPVPALKITPEHPVFAVPKHIDPRTIRDVQPEWINARDLEVGDWLVYSDIPDYVKDFPILTEDICYLYGVILRGLAGMTNLRYMTDSSRVYVRYSVGEMDAIMELFEYYFFDNLMYNSETNVLSFPWFSSSNSNLPFNRSDFYIESTTFSNTSGGNTTSQYLTVGQRWLYLPLEKTEQILAGLGDMSRYFHTGMQNYFISNAMVLYLRSRRLNECVHPELMDSVYVYHGSDSYPTIYVRIANIMETEYDGILYDLEMTKNHNYMLESGGLVHNGGGKRNGSFAIYLEPWHADIEAFLQMRKNHGDEELKARDLFYALWIPDLFMERVKADGEWTLMCPDECPGLADVWGADFATLYEKYEAEGKGRITMKARQIWFQILDAQMETGTPYLLYKDTCNRKSNQQNLGTIKSSNLCSEIIQYSDDQESAVCNLASIALPAFVRGYKDNEKEEGSNGPTFDYEKLHEVARKVVYNLNCVIDVNYYPTKKTETSNMRHRPIGLGVQGLADTFFMLGLAFGSEEAREINRRIFETIYHAAVEESCELAIRDGPYSTFAGSPASRGELQFDLWGVVPSSGRYDWDALKAKVIERGMRNSLLMAPMPTASTSQILGYNECIEPITSNIYSRRTLAGEFVMANKYLMKDLIDLGLWNERVKNNIIANNGSIQHIDLIPQDIKDRYRTVWEIPMKTLIDMAADRGAYVCQSQSLNLWQEDPNYSSLTSMHFYGWQKGLKTGIYYLRRRAKHQAQQFTIEPEKAGGGGQDHDICEMCSA